MGSNAVSRFNRFTKLMTFTVGALNGLFNRLQFVRYVLIGIGNTAFSYGIYAVLLFVGLEYRVANLLALLLGIGFSFTTQSKVVFKNATRLTFMKFVVAWLLIYLLNILLIAFFMRHAMSAYLAGALATAPVTLISYFTLKFWVFASRRSALCKNQGEQP